MTLIELTEALHGLIRAEAMDFRGAVTVLRDTFDLTDVGATDVLANDLF